MSYGLSMILGLVGGIATLLIPWIFGSKSEDAQRRLHECHHARLAAGQREDALKLTKGVYLRTGSVSAWIDAAERVQDFLRTGGHPPSDELDQVAGFARASGGSPSEAVDPARWFAS